MNGCVEGDHSIRSNPDAIKETEKKESEQEIYGISMGRDRTSTIVSDCA